jgi:hypothetical protein
MAAAGRLAATRQIGAARSDRSGMPADRQHLARAFDRLDDFLAVQGPRPAPDAVLALQLAVGIDGAARAVIRDRVAALGGPGAEGAAAPVLLGILAAPVAADEAGEA